MVHFLLTPESTIQAQKQIGADIIIPLDELPGYYTDYETLKKVSIGPIVGKHVAYKNIYPILIIKPFIV